MKRSTLSLAAALALAAAGCHVAQPGGLQAPAAVSGGSQVAMPAQPAGPPITEVAVPEGFPIPIDPARIQVVSGDQAVSGSLVGSGSVPINDTFVYFTSPDEKYYVARTAEGDASGYLVTVRTDHAGEFTTLGVFAKDTPVVANALLARNRRLVGFGTAGSASASISIGSTYAFEFFRDTVGARKLDAKALLDDESVRKVLVAESQRADSLMAEPAPDESELTIGNGSLLAAHYVKQALAQNGPAFKAWRDVFRRGEASPVYALTTLAGTFNLSDNEPTASVNATSVGLHAPTGVAQGPLGDDSVYIAERDAWHIKRVAPDGGLTVVAGRINGADPSVLGATLSADATALGGTGMMPLAFVHTIAADSKGNLAVAFKNYNIVGFVCRAAGKYFGRAMAKDTLYYLSAPDGAPGSVDEGLNENGLPKARFRDPNGMVFDDKDNLYVCDRRNNVIRRIDRATGAADTVLGDGWPFVTRIRTHPDAGHLDVDAVSLTPAEAGSEGTGNVDVSDYGRLLDQTASSGSGLKASFNRPLQIAWRKVGDKQELYVYDSYNNVVRRAVVAYSDSFKNAAVDVFVGQTRSYTDGSRPYAVTIGKTGPASDAARSAVTLDLASYDPKDKNRAQVVTGGLALDAEHGRLYLADTNNRAIRAVDLATDKVTTLARHDPSIVEGDASRAVLSQGIAGMTVLRGGDLVFCDLSNHVVRRIHLRHDF